MTSGKFGGHLRDAPEDPVGDLILELFCPREGRLSSRNAYALASGVGFVWGGVARRREVGVEHARDLEPNYGVWRDETATAVL